MTQARTQHDEDAAALVKLYGEIVKTPATDSSRGQARVNARKLLIQCQATREQLEQAVRNYSEFCKRNSSEQKYRKNSGNFFGRQAIWQGFLDGEYQPDAEGSDGTLSTGFDEPQAQVVDW